MKQTPQKFLVVGVEIEAEINNKKWAGIFNCGSYHDSHPTILKHSNREWIIERDSSLQSTKFDYGTTAEFISCPFPIDEWLRVLQNFQRGIRRNSTAKKLPLNRILNFNYSCGAHIHLSLWEQSHQISEIEARDDWITEIQGVPARRLRRIVPTAYFREVRKELFKRIQAELPAVWDRWKAQYFRHYAKRLILKRRSLTREQEWNFNPLRTVEFRSMNLNGVTTWTQFFKLWRIVFETLDKCFTEYDPQKAYLCSESISQKFNENVLRINEHIESIFEVNPSETKIETRIPIPQAQIIEQVI